MLLHDPCGDWRCLAVRLHQQLITSCGQSTAEGSLNPRDVAPSAGRIEPQACQSERRLRWQVVPGHQTTTGRERFATANIPQMVGEGRDLRAAFAGDGFQQLQQRRRRRRFRREFP